MIRIPFSSKLIGRYNTVLNNILIGRYKINRIHDENQKPTNFLADLEGKRQSHLSLGFVENFVHGVEQRHGLVPLHQLFRRQPGRVKTLNKKG